MGGTMAGMISSPESPFPGTPGSRIPAPAKHGFMPMERAQEKVLETMWKTRKFFNFRRFFKH